MRSHSWEPGGRKPCDRSKQERVAAECALYDLMRRPDFKGQESSWVCSEFKSKMPMTSHFRRSVPTPRLNSQDVQKYSKGGHVNTNIPISLRGDVMRLLSALCRMCFGK